MSINKKLLSISIPILFILSIAKIFNLVPNYLGALLLFVDSIIFFISLESVCKHFKINSNKFIKLILLLSYYSISLSLIYYLCGLNKFSLSIWISLNFLLSSIFLYKQKEINLPKLNYKSSLKKNSIGYISGLLIIALILVLFFNPITNGSPSPWLNIFYFCFIMFSIITLILSRELLFNKKYPFVAFLYFFLIIEVIAIRFIFSYGYDTLIHQSSLKYILENGQITPLTPFYIGQYVLEILLNVFSGLSFTFIERWLGPTLFLTLMFLGANYLLKNLKIKNNYLLIPFSVVLLFPNIFSYTSPFALSLLWGIISIIFIITFLNNNKTTDLKLSIICSLTSLFVHPFVGLNIFIWSLGIYFINKKNYFKKRKNSSLTTLFLITSFVVAIAFLFYNWVNGSGLNIYNPFHFIRSFSDIFGDPIWYVRDHYPWWLGLIYFYEKIYFFLLFFLVLYYPLKKLEKTKEIIILISASALISAWFFVSGFKIDNYYYGDQVNYSHRLIQVSKWFLWPIFLIILSDIIEKIKRTTRIRQITLLTSLAILISVSWYLTYPRQDEISRASINSIRSVDYAAIDLVYNNEKGKNNYIVLSNQIIGAGAILQYGFGPYYQLNNESIFYYSLPWGGKLSKLYDEIMSSETDEIDKPLKELKKIFDQINIDKFYFVYTDAWSPSPIIIKQLEETSVKKWNINDKVFILLLNN